MSKENLVSINGNIKPSEIPASVVVPKTALIEPPPPKTPDLLQPLKIEELNNDSNNEKIGPAAEASAADLSELNLHCVENELGAIIVKSTKQESAETLDKNDESADESEEISSDQSFDLMCRETLSPTNAK